MQVRALAESDWHVDVAWPAGTDRWSVRAKGGFRGPANGRRYPAVGTDRWSVRNVTRPTVGCYRGKAPQALYRLGCNIVPVHFFEPQRHSQIFFRRAVWRSARVMP